MQISKKSQYGLRAMVYLAKKCKKNEFVPLKEISLKEEIPFDFLEKIIALLEKENLVRGRKGYGGGYILGKSPSRITIFDIVKILEKTTPVNCVFCGRIKGCAAKNVWKKVDLAINKTLNSIKLKDLIS